MATSRGARAKITSVDDFLSHARIETVPDPAATRSTRDYYAGKTGSQIPDLNDMVWQSYQTGKFMMVPCPPELVDYVKAQILLAKNYLNHIHHDEVGPSGMKGVDDKKKLLVIDIHDPDSPYYVTDPAKRAEYEDEGKLRPGEVGVLFQARPPRQVGRRAMNAREARAAADKATATLRAKAASAKAPSAVRRSRGASTKAEINNTKAGASTIPFSG